MSAANERQFRNFGVIIAPDKIVIPEHFGITRTARSGNTEAYLAATRIENALSLDAIGIHFAGKILNPFKS